LGSELDQAHGYPDFSKPFSFWKEFLVFRKRKIGGEEAFNPEFLKSNPSAFWAMF
jgi:NAD-dependent SIR2 family protein deacetylase